MTPASRRRVLQGGLFGVACACLGAQVATAADAPAPAPGVKYVCPTCGCASDGKEFDKPGVCPEPGCGMLLVPKAASTPPPKARASLVRGSGGDVKDGWGTRISTPPEIPQ